jgi:hypothetical protein
MLAVADGSDHEILPVPGSARQLDGAPADLLAPMDYPMEALCLACGRPVRCERWLMCEWRHIDAFTLAAPTAGGQR